jgi:acetoin utilization protein AcuB
LAFIDVMGTSLHSKTTRELSRATKIGEVMTRAPHTIGSDQTLAHAHKVMREHGLRHLPVLRGGTLVGVLSERDLLFLETIAGVDIDIDSVADAMTPEVYTAHPDDSVQDVARTMAVRRHGCAVIIEGTRVLGIFTATDALRHLADSLR